MEKLFIYYIMNQENVLYLYIIVNIFFDHRQLDNLKYINIRDRSINIII